MSSSRKIKAILFDLDGTLRLNLPAAGEVFIDYVRSIGVHPSEEDRIRAEHWEHRYFASSPEVKSDNQKFKNDLRGFWVNFAKRRLIALGLPEARAIELAPQVSDHMDKSYKPNVHVPEEAFPLLNYLKDEKYILGVVSNRDDPFHDELSNLNLAHYFKFTLAGGEVGSFKPEPRIFERALELSGTSAAETMYVGDNYFADIVGALRAGLIPVHYDPENLFPDSKFECAVIKSYSEFYNLLQ